MGPESTQTITLITSKNIFANSQGASIFLFRGYVPHARESIGIQCKRLIDAGRVWYLQQKGFDVEQCHYVDKEVSLENTLIVATLTNERIRNPCNYSTN